MGFSNLNLLRQRELVCMLITAAISLITRKSALFHNQLLIAFKMSQRWNTCNLAITVSKLMASTQAFHSMDSNESVTFVFWSFFFFHPLRFLFIWNALDSFWIYLSDTVCSECALIYKTHHYFQVISPERICEHCLDVNERRRIRLDKGEKVKRLDFKEAQKSLFSFITRCSSTYKLLRWCFHNRAEGTPESQTCKTDLFNFSLRRTIRSNKPIFSFPFSRCFL